MRRRREREAEREREREGGREEGGGREREKGRRHNNRRGKLRKPREIWKTLTIGEHWGRATYREIQAERSRCLSWGVEILFPRV